MGILDTITDGIFKKSGGSFTEDAFGFEGATLTAYVDAIFTGDNADVLKFFYQQLYRDFAPDINGYTLIFFIPPHLSGYEFNNGASNLYNQEDKESYMSVVGKIMTFAAVDFTPPQNQVRTENVSTRSGSIPIASEVSESETCSVTFVDNQHLDIYMFHHIWVEYIREILEGTLEPDPKYYQSNYFDEFGEDANYGSIDYAASFYIVKYRPDMQKVTFVAKCVGVFPQSLPNKELIGSRSTNEIVTLPFTYSCSGYREALHMESDNWIFGELNEITSRFGSQSSSPLFGGFLGGIISNVIGPTSGMLKNLTGNAAKLGGITGTATSSLKSTWNTIQGIAKPNGFSSIFKV